MATKEQFKKLLKILDNLYGLYQEMSQLFEEKKEILKHAKTDELGPVDSKILALNEQIVKISKAREKLSIDILGQDGKMSDYISLAEDTAPEFVEALKDRKVKICNISDRMLLQNNQNVELMKHGVVITNKMLETIINVFAPQGSNYNGAGKTTNTQDLDMWTVNEEV